ncbi:hypothetical protein BofuT4_uP134290.1 [Botrytis cinerea T4]|uniref:Uncharacterized protein n=1 Tax=Botryotinia fuckeliana (strain T4) TaxID=999810 RepID=G2YP36_BOTF4|nr:hypothetical protein BofuT4_uP134290.1 [Botrytis cinerea T4]
MPKWMEPGLQNKFTTQLRALQSYANPHITRYNSHHARNIHFPTGRHTPKQTRFGSSFEREGKYHIISNPQLHNL